MDGHTGKIEASIRGEFSLCEADNNGTGRLEVSSQRELSLCEAENDGPGRVEATGGGELILCEAANVVTGRIEASGAVELVLCEVDNDGIRRKETSGGGELSSCEADRNQEPCEGMLFESEETARAFYDEYAIRVGFVTRVLSSRKSERDGSIISRGLGCRGGSDNHGIDSVASHKRDGRREGCTAMILVKRERPGRWVVRKFVRDHTHPLVVSLPMHKRRQTFDEKDKKIQELTAELRVKKRLSAAYREQLLTLMKDVEDHNEHLSTKVQVVHKNLKKLEAKRRELLHKK